MNQRVNHGDASRARPSSLFREIYRYRRSVIRAIGGSKLTRIPGGRALAVRRLQRGVVDVV